MRKFKFKFSGITISLLIAVIIISIIACVVNAISLAKLFFAVIKNPFKIVLCVVVIVCALIAVILTTIALLNSYYKVDGKTLNLNFGLIKNKYDINTVTEIFYFKKQDKLVIYFGEKFFVVVIDNKDYNDFISAMRNANPKIIYENKTSNGEIN